MPIDSEARVSRDSSDKKLCELDKIPLSAHKRLILSPPPNNFCSESVSALEEAIERSSRSQSLNGSCNNLNSKQNVLPSRPHSKHEIYSFKSLLCCMSSQSATHKRNRLPISPTSPKSVPDSSKSRSSRFKFLKSPSSKSIGKDNCHGSQPFISPNSTDSQKEFASLIPPKVNAQANQDESEISHDHNDSHWQSNYEQEHEVQLLVEIKSNLLGTVDVQFQDKKCLVLDLDETLVHSSFSEVSNADFTVNVELDDKIHQVYVLKRPFLDEFLASIKPLFEIVMFTASMKQYADPVCDQIDKFGSMRHRLFRDSCVCFQRNFYKDLTALGRDLNQICIIDNSPLSFARQLPNALQVRSWYNDPSDRTLLQLIPYLTGMAMAKSAREYLANVKPSDNCALAAPEGLAFDFDDDLRRFDDEDELPSEGSESEEEFVADVPDDGYVNSPDHLGEYAPPGMPSNKLIMPKNETYENEVLYGRHNVGRPIFSKTQPSTRATASDLPTYLMHQKLPPNQRRNLLSNGSAAQNPQN